MASVPVEAEAGAACALQERRPGTKYWPGARNMADIRIRNTNIIKYDIVLFRELMVSSVNDLGPV